MRSQPAPFLALAALRSVVLARPPLPGSPLSSPHPPITSQQTLARWWATREKLQTVIGQVSSCSSSSIPSLAAYWGRKSASARQSQQHDGKLYCRPNDQGNNLAVLTSAYVAGHDEEARSLRSDLIRYINLAQGLLYVQVRV